MFNSRLSTIRGGPPLAGDAEIGTHLLAEGVQPMVADRRGIRANREVKV